MIRHLVIAAFCALILPVLAFAVGDDFTVTQQIGIDTTPPTVPTGVSTTPVTTTQINITWSSSTDAGVGVTGYQLFRDNVQIATTTLLSYSDVGLTPSTTYAYNVTAFDLFLNISARSATSSTTTLPVPVVATTAPQFGSKDIELVPIELVISGVQTVTEDISATVNFITSGFAIASVKYGTTPQYETGSLASGIYEKNHSFTLTDLEPNRRYFFEISATNQRGDTVFYQASFVTEPLIDIIPPTNVSNFTAVADGEHVDLSWDNPSERDFDRVRIVANHRFYPVDINDGELVYDGDGETFRHEWVYPENNLMYYTIFALDEEGNQSSGAIAHVRWVSLRELGIDTVDSPAIILPSPEGGVHTTPPVRDMPGLTFDGLEFIQDARLHQGLQSYVELDPNKSFTVRVPYELVPEHLKAMTVTLVDPDDPTKTFAFLLRVNERKTHYEATIGALKRQAVYPLHFALLNFKTQEILSFTGAISTVPSTEQTYPDAIPTPTEQAVFIFSRWWWWLIIVLLLLIAYWLMKD